MRIIKKGNMQRLPKFIFECDICGCEWEAHEYEVETWLEGHNEEVAYCECPTCGNFAYSRRIKNE